MHDDIWSQTPDILSLDCSTVHLWYARLDLADKEVAAYREILSADERMVSDRFAFDLDRKSYTLAHGALRSILALYLDIDARQITFSHSQYGKPALTKNLKDYKILFNLSHSRDFALIGLAYKREIGVDIEFMCNDFDFMKIAETYFTPREYSCLLKSPDYMKKETFFRYWTYKEAFMKATGIGLSLPMNKVEVSTFPDQPITLLESDQRNGYSRKWNLMHIGCDPEYTAAVAVEGGDWDLKYFRW